MLFKLYLLGQLIAMPFMIGAIGDLLGSSDSPSVNPNVQAQAQGEPSADILTNGDLCEAVKGTAVNSVQDSIQQLRFITAELYGEDELNDCFNKSEP